MNNVSPDSSNSFRVMIDGEQVGFVGGRADSDLNTGMFLIPAGSTYGLDRDGGTSNIYKWHEARMPLAIANPSVETAIGMVAPFAMDSVPT